MFKIYLFFVLAPLFVTPVAWSATVKKVGKTKILILGERQEFQVGDWVNIVNSNEKTVATAKVYKRSKKKFYGKVKTGKAKKGYEVLAAGSSDDMSSGASASSVKAANSILLGVGVFDWKGFDDMPLNFSLDYRRNFGANPFHMRLGVDYSSVSEEDSLGGQVGRSLLEFSMSPELLWNFGSLYASLGTRLTYTMLGISYTDSLGTDSVTYGFFVVYPFVSVGMNITKNISFGVEVRYAYAVASFAEDVEVADVEDLNVPHFLGSLSYSF